MIKRYNSYLTNDFTLQKYLICEYIKPEQLHLITRNAYIAILIEQIERWHVIYQYKKTPPPV